MIHTSHGLSLVHTPCLSIYVGSLHVHCSEAKIGILLTVRTVHVFGSVIKNAK